MDVPDSNIIIVDENEATLREQVLSKIIAAALLEQVQIHNKKIKTVTNTKES